MKIQNKNESKARMRKKVGRRSEEEFRGDCAMSKQIENVREENRMKRMRIMGGRNERKGRKREGRDRGRESEVKRRGKEVSRKGVVREKQELKE